MKNCDTSAGYCFLHDKPEGTEESNSCDDWEEDDDDDE